MTHYDTARSIERGRKREEEEKKFKNAVRDRLYDLTYEEAKFLYNITYRDDHGKDNLKDVMDFFKLNEKVEDIVNGDNI